MYWVDPRGLDFIWVAGGRATYFDSNNRPVHTAPFVSGHPGITDSTLEGIGPTPPGFYTIENPPGTVNSATNPDNWKSFCDGGANCWWAAYKPKFSTPNNRCLPEPLGTGNCGMHPAQNNQTAGCTGLTDRDTTKMRDLISAYGPSASNPLPVFVGDSLFDIAASFFNR